MRARAVALAGLLLLLRAAAAADDARIAVVGDDGRFGLGNVVLGASSAVVYAALSERAVRLARTPLLTRLCAALDADCAFEDADSAVSAGAARPVFVGKGVAAKDLPPFDDATPTLELRFQLFCDDFWAAPRARPTFARALARFGGAASMWAVHQRALSSLLGAAPPAGADLAIHVRARPRATEPEYTVRDARDAARADAHPAADARAAAAFEAALPRIVACLVPFHVAPGARAVVVGDAAAPTRALAAALGGGPVADGTAFVVAPPRAGARAAGVAAAAAAAPTPPPPRAAQHSRDGLGLNATVADLRALAQARAVLQLVVSTPPLTHTSTFGLLAAVWAGAEYHEIVLDLAKGTCDCHKPEMLQPNTTARWGRFTHCSTNFVRRKRRRRRRT